MIEVIKIRLALLGDAAAIAAVHNAAWRAAYRGIVPDDHLDSLDDLKASGQWAEILKKQKKENQFHLVAEGADGKLFGFAGGGPKSTSADKSTGQLYSIYVDPQSQGRGVGRDLFLESCRRLKDLGYRGMVVWALRKAENARFYEKYGGKVVDLQQVEIGTTLEEVCWAFDSLDQLIRSQEAR